MTLKIGLIQINSAYQNYLPYSVGLLQAYVLAHAQHPDNYEFLLPLYSLKSSIEDAIYKVRDANIVGFSCYIWNINKNLMLAKRLKEINPEVLIIFGGPQCYISPLTHTHALADQRSPCKLCRHQGYKPSPIRLDF